MGMPGIVIQVGADTKDAVDGINRLRGELGESLSGFGKFKAGVDKAFLPAVAAIGALGVAAVDFSKAAAEDAKEAGILANALKNTTGATDDQVKATEDWISAQGRALGVSDSELRPALAKLAAATGSVGEAQKAAALAMDIAAQTGAPLEVVSQKLAMAYGGQTAGLKKLVPGLDAAVLASGDMAAIQAMLAEKVGGAAQVVGDSAAGQMQRFSLAIDEAKEGIGAALLPVIQEILPYVLQFAQWAQDNTQTLIVIGGVIAGVAGTIIVLKGAIMAWTVVQTALNIALSANPIGLVVLAIAALIAGIVLMYNKVDWFRNFVDAAWAGIKVVIGAVVDWFTNTIVPAFKAAIAAIGQWWTDHQAQVKAVWNGIKVAIDLVVQWFNNVLRPAFQAVFALLSGDWSGFVGYIRELWSGLLGFLRSLGDVFAGIGRALVDGIRSGVQNAWGSFVNWMKGLAGDLVNSIKAVFGISSPSKVFAGIGRDIVAGYRVGLAGMDTVNANLLDGMASVTTAPALTVTGATSATQLAGAGAQLSEEMVARALAQLLMRSDLRNGRTAVAV